MLRDRYELKPEGDPTEPDSSPLRPPRLRRCAAMGTDADSPPSFNEAATAAAALAAAVVTLFRRVTRWLALTAPRDIEWAWDRWLELGRGRERDNSYSRRAGVATSSVSEATKSMAGGYPPTGHIP